MIRHYQHKTLNPQLVYRKLEEFFKEDNIDFDITTISTQANMQKTVCHFTAKEDIQKSQRCVLNYEVVLISRTHICHTFLETQNVSKKRWLNVIELRIT